MGTGTTVPFLELVDALKHVDGFLEFGDGDDGGSGVVATALGVYKRAHIQRKSINSLLRSKILVATPFHSIGWIGADPFSYVCDENVPATFRGVRPTPRDLRPLSGLDPETERIAESLDPILRRSLYGETSNDGKILRYAGNRNLPLVTSDVIMAMRFKRMFPHLRVVIPTMGWLVSELKLP